MGKFTYHEKCDYSDWKRRQNKQNVKRELEAREDDETEE